jgi:hypothetical protein
MNLLTGWIGRALGRFLSARRHAHTIAAPTGPGRLLACLRPGDVLLVEGDSRVSVAIKYLTQSTWSHAALYVAGALGRCDARGETPCFVEADLVEGVRAVAASTFAGMHCRICRPLSLSRHELDRVVAFAVERIGLRYDLKNVVDLARYLVPVPPVPVRWRRRMLALGSGDPTRAICSTLIAQAFQSVRYPILPIIESIPSNDPKCPACVAEILHVRHHSLFVPRDFDVSPYFEVIKPAVVPGFDHHALVWSDGAPAHREAVVAAAAPGQARRADSDMPAR